MVRESPARFNMADYFLYDRLAEGQGERVAIRTRVEAWTYARVAAESNRVGNALRQLGVQPQQRVLISLPDIPEFAAAIFGALRVGGVVAMVNNLLPAEDLAYYIEYTACRVLLCDRDVAARIEPMVARFPHLAGVIVVGEPRTSPPFHPYTGIVRNASDRCEPAPTGRDDPAYWLFTSGSTGKPKAVVHRHRDFPWHTERYAKQVVRYTENDVTLSVARLFFGYGTGTNLFFPFAVGATTCLFPEKPTPEALFGHIEHFKPTILTSVPTSINAMVSHPDAGKHDLSSLRAVISAGEALPAELYHRWQQQFGVEILDGIGAAETFHIYISNAPGDVVPGCLGKLVPGFEAKIADEQGRELGDNEIGTLWVKGDSAGVGYWDAPEKTRETFHGDWVKSADLFRRDADGRYWYCGRADDLLKVGGMFLSPLEVEDCLLQHPAVAECALVAYQEQGLDRPLAFVVLKPGHEPDAKLALDLARFVKAKLAAYKFPRRVQFVRELPRNDRGKVERKRLREELSSQGLASSFDTDLSAAKRGG
ncbi:MAG TPA: benzoate-CoA ligase family protein [Candidatus Thermoplasmatota archaeon]|jgi:benzoate-CoA ligase|nr:benzoate-CoA ligase family protein [Candidatus Thermoplasmatota archaeon]